MRHDFSRQLMQNASAYGEHNNNGLARKFYSHNGSPVWSLASYLGQLRPRGASEYAQFG